MLDMMPTDPTILGFGRSRWYARGFETARTYRLPNGAMIFAFDVIHLLAAKIEAYCDRGHGDWMLSQDVEDIVTVLDGRSTIVEELEVQSEASDFVWSWLFSFTEDELLEVLGTSLSDYGRGRAVYRRLLRLRERTP